MLIGFAIGAAMSMLQQRNDSGVAVAVPSATDTDVPTPAPSVTPRPSTPFPAVVPTVVHTLTPTPSPTPTPTPVPTRSPSPSPSPSPSVQPTTVPSAAATAAPTPTPTAAPLATVAPAPSAAPTVAVEVASEFAREAVQAVRGYLTAIQRGDEDTAYAALGGEAGSPGLVLSEDEFMDRTARIVSMHGTGTATSAAVRVDIVSDKGEYTADYTVDRGPKGPIIRNHDFTQAH
ncbi:MAG TPA: hypothetical protein VGD50_03745 [Candidatus Baltobacteraceae bacterium]